MSEKNDLDHEYNRDEKSQEFLSESIHLIFVYFLLRSG